ncbi:hypothetical protein TRICI_000054 [Trichomonascus ciferrii]|uniref:PRELI/MSF1 domain-containing protein n=1 Tax=Trichomonascus ciferrii TaxID=44093 RepID=A0A642VEE3_9ASCO|nr:hypothetical protein TRICI_000054 [Trichomonascus ciferrii]
MILVALTLPPPRWRTSTSIPSKCCIEDKGRDGTNGYGRLPAFIKPFMGKISESWVLETTKIDPNNCLLESRTRNLDHTKVLKVDERTVYKSDSLTAPTTLVSHNVSFVSNFGWGVRDRIENWSYRRFSKNIAESRKGMAFVMRNLREKGVTAFRQYQLKAAQFGTD